MRIQTKASALAYRSFVNEVVVPIEIMTALAADCLVTGVSLLP